MQQDDAKYQESFYCLFFLFLLRVWKCRPEEVLRVSRRREEYVKGGHGHHQDGEVHLPTAQLGRGEEAEAAAVLAIPWRLAAAVAIDREQSPVMRVLL